MADEKWWESDPLAGSLATDKSTSWWSSDPLAEGQEPPPAKPQGIASKIAEFGLDFGKRAAGAVVGGVASIPTGVQSGIRSAVRNAASADADAVMPAGVYQPGLDTDATVHGPETQLDSDKRLLQGELTAKAVRLPGADALAQAGKEKQQAINETASQATKDAVANTRITGNLLKGEIDFGKDPSLRGFVMQGADVFGSMLPVVATALVTRSPNAAGAVGGAMAAGEGAGNAKEYVAKMTDAQLQEHSPLYQRMVSAGATPAQAREIVSARAEDASALLQGAVATLGDRFTGSLVTGGLDKALTRVAGKSVLGRTAAGGALSSLEEGTQELSEGVASDIGTKAAVRNKEVGEDSAANFVLGAIGGGAPGAIRGAVARGDAPAGAATQELPQPAPTVADAAPVDVPPVTQAEAAGAAPVGVPVEAATAAPSAADPLARLAELEIINEQRDLTPDERQEAAALLSRLDDEQDASQGTQGASGALTNEGASPQAAPDQATENAAGNAPASDGVPATGGNADVQTAGVEAAPVDADSRSVLPQAAGPAPTNFWSFAKSKGLTPGQIKVGTPEHAALKAEYDALKGGQAAPILPPMEAPQDVNLQNRDRGRAVSVVQMSDIARNPDYMRLGPSRTPDSGAPMVFAVGDDLGVIPTENFGREDMAVMSDGQRVPFRYAVVDATKVNPSNFADGRTNPDFSSGAPGVLKALNNGRTAGIRAAHEMGTAGEYVQGVQADAAMHGVSPDVVARTPNPMLVRIYADAENTAGMAAKSQGQGLGMSPAELARQDAPLLDASVLSAYQPGDVTSAANRDFVRAFVGRLNASGLDIAGMMTGDGQLSQDGRKRIQAALMQAAYGDADLVEEMFDSTDTDIKAIGEALKTVAGQWANMRDSARLGVINPEVDITQNLLQAVGLIRKARRDGVSLYDLVNQPDLMTGEPPDALTVGALRMFYSGFYLTRALGKDRLAQNLNAFVRGAMATSADAGIFGEVVSPGDILAAIIPITEGQANAEAQSEESIREPVGSVDTGGGPGEGQSGIGRPWPEEGGAGPDQDRGSEPGQNAPVGAQQQTGPGGEGSQEGDAADEGRPERGQQGGIAGEAGAVTEAPAGDGQGDPAPLLESYTPEELAAREDAQAAAERQRASAAADAESRSQADAERDGFALTGSDRPADVLEAQGQAPMFSMDTSPSPASEPDATADLQEILRISSQSDATVQRLVKATQDAADTIRSGWANAPEVVVVFDMQDTRVPDAVRRNERTQESRRLAGEADGFFYNGKVYLVASQLPSEADVRRVLFHESLGHYGLRGVFGESGLQPILQQIVDARRPEVAAKAKAYGLDMGVPADRLMAAEEVLAEMAEKAPTLGFVRRAVAAVRNWLRSNVPGMDALALSDSDIIQGYILPARGWVERGSMEAEAQEREAARQPFSPAFSISENVGEKALAEFAKADDLYALPKSKKETLQGIAEDIDPEIKVRVTRLPGETMYTLTHPDIGGARITERAGNPYGPSLYGYNQEDGEITDQITERPGDNPEDVDPRTSDVWLDVSLLKPGKGGEKVYAIAANYAHNTGQIFIGDPAGLSAVALRRRLEQMLSSALKFGTTAHLAPHPDQVRGGSGVPPLRWVYGDHVGNVERMIAASVKALDNSFPTSKIIAYDSSRGFYRTDTGSSLARGELAIVLGRSAAKHRVAHGAGATGQAGWRTLARAALFRHIQSAIGAEHGGIQERGRLLARAGEDVARLSSEGTGSAPFNAHERIFYSRGPAGGGNVVAPGGSPSQGNPQVAELPAETSPQYHQRRHQDRLNRFTVIKEWLAGQGVKLSESADVYKAEERMHARFANKAQDFREKRLNPLIQKAQKAGFTLDDVAQFLHAQHAEERNNQIAKINQDRPDGGSGMKTAEAKTILAAAPAELKAIANEFRQITEDSKNILLKAGIISKETADAWDGAYKFYVPLKGGPDGGKGTGKGLSVNGKQKRALGHDVREEGEWILENIVADHERALMLSEKNLVGLHLLRMAAEAGRDDLVTIGKPKRRQVLKSQSAYVVEKNGVRFGVYQTEEAAKLARTLAGVTGVTISKTTEPSVVLMATPQLQDNEVNVYVRGMEVRLQINDELLARAYKNMGDEALGTILSAGRTLNAYFSKIYTGYNPEFIQVNLIRDFATGLLNVTGEEGFGMAVKAVRNYPSRFAELFRYARTNNETKWVKMYREDGGNTGAAYLSDMERLGSDIATEYAVYQGVKKNLDDMRAASSGKAKMKAGWLAARAAGRKVFEKTLVWVERLNQAGENAMRLSVYQAMIESGRTRNEAASLAKNATVNFNRKGELGKQANALFLFYNAGVQGTAAIAHAHMKGKYKGQARALSMSLVGLGYMMSLLAVSGDEDEYEDVSESERSRNMLIDTGDGFVKIPVPYGYGFFWNAGRVLADAQRKGDAGKLPWQLATSFVQEMTPFGNAVAGSEPSAKQAFLYSMPTVVQIVGSPVLNQTGMGGPMMPESGFDPHQPDRDKMWRQTRGSMADTLAGALEAAGLDVSPETIKHYGRTFTGGAGTFLTTVADGASLTLSGAELETSEVPFLRKMYMVPDVRGSRARYNEAKNEATKYMSDYRRAVKAENLDLAEQIAVDNQEMLQAAKMAQGFSKLASAQRDMIDNIRLKGNYSKAEERSLVKQLETQERELYREYLDELKGLKRAKMERLEAAK